MNISIRSITGDIKVVAAGGGKNAGPGGKSPSLWMPSAFWGWAPSATEQCFKK